jgi:nucleotide-binding universal stress UspA family protein
MFRKILVPTDGSKLSDKAVKSAVALAAACGGSLVVFHAYPKFYGGAYGTFEMATEVLAEVHEKQGRAEAAAIFAAAKTEADKSGVACETVALESDHPWESIIAVAKKKKCDSICMASHGRRGLAGVLLGSETVKVLTHATLPVLVLR